MFNSLTMKFKQVFLKKKKSVLDILTAFCVFIPCEGKIILIHMWNIF